VADTLRVLSSPVRVTGGLRVAQLVTLVTAECLASSGAPSEWIPGVLAGDLATQMAVEQDLAREGLDRASVDRADFASRARQADAEARAATEDVLVELGLRADLNAGALDGDAVALAARTAFVRLYEAGMLVRAERVVSGCPRCATVIDEIDTEWGSAPAEAVTVALVASNGAELDVPIVCVELLPGAVAVAVPTDHPAAGATVELPLAGRGVPVLVGDDHDVAALVVPAHDHADLELADRKSVV